jgi:polar amino acid transport system substrate-binding protein
MKRLAWLSVLAFLLAPAASSADTLKIAAIDWEPYAGKALKDNGFCAVIATEAFRRAGCQVGIDFMPWGMAIEQAGKGDYDAVFPVHFFEEIARDFIYSNVLSSSVLVFYRAASPAVSYRTLADLSPFRVGVVRGCMVNDEFDNAAWLRKLEAACDEENLGRLLRGEVDLIVIDRLAARHIIATRMPEAGGRLVSMDPPLQIHHLFVVFPRGKPSSKRLASEFNRALESMKKDGTLKTIMEGRGTAR